MVGRLAGHHRILAGALGRGGNRIRYALHPLHAIAQLLHLLLDLVLDRIGHGLQRSDAPFLRLIIEFGELRTQAARFDLQRLNPVFVH